MASASGADGGATDIYDKTPLQDDLWGWIARDRGRIYGNPTVKRRGISLFHRRNITQEPSSQEGLERVSDGWRTHHLHRQHRR